jgi:nitric oxide reductase NorQ protein
MQDERTSPAPVHDRGHYEDHWDGAVTHQALEIEREPFYVPVADEVTAFAAAHANRLPVMLKGPTGCGKTRFVRYMAHRLDRPLISVACHDDLTASDLIGRFLIRGDETVWVDGPLTQAVRSGAICYLDEVVEARKDTTVVIHPLTDDRRRLRVEKTGEVLQAPPEFMLVISYNPGYQSLLKNLKQSTRQRFVALEFAFPPRDAEIAIVSHEAGVDQGTAARLVQIGELIRNLKEAGLEEPASTRLLIYAGLLVKGGLDLRRACELAIAAPLSDDPAVLEALTALIATVA